MKTERNERGQSVPLPLRVTQLKLLRLPFIRSLRVENSRNPGRWAAAMLISPILFNFVGRRFWRTSDAGFKKPVIPFFVTDFACSIFII